jgi:hypothetical protein
MDCTAFLDYLADDPATAGLGRALTDILVGRRVLSPEHTPVERASDQRVAS